jgi:hypothetical protein
MRDMIFLRDSLLLPAGGRKRQAGPRTDPHGLIAEGHSSNGGYHTRE